MKIKTDFLIISLLLFSAFLIGCKPSAPPPDTPEPEVIEGGEVLPEEDEEESKEPETIEYSLGLFVEYTGGGIENVYGAKRIPFGVNSNNKIVSPGGSFEISGNVGEFSVHGTVNIKLDGELEYNKSDKNWLFHLMLRPSINNYIWEAGGIVLDNSMEEWEAPFVMPFEDGAVLEYPNMIFRFTLQDIPMWPVPLVD